MSRATFRAVGPFDESYRHYAQDLDYCRRLASAGGSVRVLADWVVVHHLGGSLGQASGADGQQLDLLWLDLLHWARRHRGAAWARRARAALLAGGRLRLLRLARRRGEQRGDRRGVRRPGCRGGHGGHGGRRRRRSRRRRRRMTAAG